MPIFSDTQFDSMTFEETLEAMGLVKRDALITTQHALRLVADMLDLLTKEAVPCRFHTEDQDFLISKPNNEELARLVYDSRTCKYTVWARPLLHAAQ